MIFSIFAFLVCFALPFIFKKILSKNRLATAKEKPMFLGISIYLSVFVVFIYALFYHVTDNPFLVRLLAGSSFMLFIGILDDVKKLSVKTKLLGQIVAACIVIFMGSRTAIAYFPAWINMLITLVWILTLINAFNFLDIMDGLCTGISFIVCVIFLVISIISGMHGISMFFWILSGATLAAFIHNVPGARFYLGDSGSMLVGFIFACSTMQLSYAPDTTHGLSLLVPLLIMFLPIYDLILTVFMRWRKRIAIFKKSNDHLVLILKNKGFSVRKILTIMYISCLFSGGSAVLLKILPLNAKPWFLVFFAGVVFTFNIFMVKIIKTSNQAIPEK